MSSEQGLKIGDMVEVIHGYRHSERRGIIEDIPAANDALILVEFDNGEQLRIDRNTVRKLPAGLKHTFIESDYVVINAPGSTYDGVTGRIAEVHEVGDGYGYIVHLAANESLALGAYRADQLRKLGGSAPVPTQADFDAMYRAHMAEQYRRQDEQRAQAEQDGKRLLKVGGAYVAVDQITSIRDLQNGHVKIMLGEITVTSFDADDSRRLLEWADRNSLDLGG